MWSQLLPAAVVVVEATAAMWSTPPTPPEAQCIANAVPKRRREFQAGRAAARAALDLLGIDRFDLIPGAHREPLWPDGIVGSITHTAHHCAAAAARQAEITSVGIDLATAEELVPGLIAIICREEERRNLSAGHEAGQGIRAKIIFSAKEAFFKAYFPHAHSLLGFHGVSVALHPSSQEFEAALVDSDLPPLFGNRRAIGRYGIRDGLIYAAVATVP